MVAQALELIANLSAEFARLSKRVETLEDRLLTPTIGRNECKPLTREEVVAQAKSDVVALSKPHWNGSGDTVYGRGIMLYNVEFIVNREKRTVVALLKRYRGGTIDYKGIAKATPDDCFNVHIGKAIALRRALGLEVPKEYTHCPQPTEAKVGDTVKLINIDVIKTVEYNGWEVREATSQIKSGDVRVIDDSDREVIV